MWGSPKSKLEYLHTYINFSPIVGEATEGETLYIDINYEQIVCA